MNPITGTIITYNEEDHIEACIASLRRVCDEIIVVDSLSTDRTSELARAAGAHVIPQEYLGEGRQRNVTERSAAHDWILALDADERLDDEMAAAIRALSLDEADTAYSFNRKSFVGGRWLRGPGWYPDHVTRLYNRTRSAYEPKPGHAGVLAPRVRKAPGHILHYTYDGLSDWISKINWLTSRDAQGMFDAGKPPSKLRPVLSATGAAFRQLILRGGLLRGADGWTITVTSVFRSYMKYAKLNELHERASAGDGAKGLQQLGRMRDTPRR
jgi:glycosyltransferase involved in cell wall biosynthesis